MTNGLIIDPNAPTKSVISIPNNTPYIIAVVIMVSIGVGGIILIWLARPEAMDNMLITAAVFTFIGPTTLSLLAFMKSQETHLSVNSRLDAFMSNAVKAARSEGLIQGKIEGNIESDARTDSLAHKGKK